MAEINITIKNLPQIKAAFGKSPMVMLRNLNIAIEGAVKSIEARSRSGTPIDTGRLRASHYTSFSNLKGEVGTDTSYDIFVHEGTRFMRARPYLRNAVNASQVTTDQWFTKAVQKTLDQIASET